MKATKKVKETVQDVIKDLKKSSPDGGEINLDDFCKKLPNENRWEVVAALRQATGGVFVTGRRGLKSRFVFGDKAESIAESISQRRAYRKNRSGETNNHKEKATVHAPLELGTQSFGLKIQIGNQVTTIPVNIEMVPTS